MKWFLTLDVKTNGSLRVKRPIMIFTSQRGKFDSKKDGD